MVGDSGMRTGLLVSVGLASLLCACSSTPKATLAAKADNTIPFDRGGTFVVTTQSDSIAARNAASDLRDALVESGYRIAGAEKNDYILTINPVQRSYTYTAHDLVSTNTSANGSIDGAPFSLSGTSYTLVPYTATGTFNGYVAELFDGRLDKNPISIWRGAIAADGNLIESHEATALRLLVSNLGRNADPIAVGLQDEDHPPLVPSNELSQTSMNVQVPADAAYFFPSTADTVNAMRGTYAGQEYQGYVRTRPVRTNRFDGYVQNDGLSEFRGAVLSTDEVPSWAIGLGAYVLRSDGVYTENQPQSLRDLGTDGLQKIISFPIQVGARNQISIAGSTMSITVEAQEAVQTPYGSFSDCYKLRREMSRNGMSDSDFVWACRGVGIARIEHATGRDDVLVAIGAAN